MMGEVALEARGVRWRDIPLNVGFSLRLNLHAEPRERQLMLWAVEQSLMPGEAGKRADHETAMEAGRAVHRKTWPALEEYRKLELQTEWWSAFVREVLGRDSHATPRQLVEDPTVITE